MNKDKIALTNSILSMKKLLENAKENLHYELYTALSDDLSLLRTLLKIAEGELETLKKNP